MPQEYRLILKNVDAPGYTPDLECYVRHGGYEALKKALALRPRNCPTARKCRPQEQIRDEVKTSGLRGRGGAGFSCGLKWSFVDLRGAQAELPHLQRRRVRAGHVQGPADHPQGPAPIAGGDDHRLLRQQCSSGLHLYPRRNAGGGAASQDRALAEARAKNFLGKNILGSGYDLEIYIHRGAGAYICGEETGLIESLEGKRAYPRIKPPYFPAILGLYQCPTIVNNVETLAAVKHIVLMGGAEYAKLGAPNNTGTRIVSISGHVRKPGYYEIEVGKATLGELIFHENFGGGLRDGAAAQGGHSRRLLGQGLQGGRKIQAQENRGRTARWRRWRWTCWICPTISIRAKRREHVRLGRDHCDG